MRSPRPFRARLQRRALRISVSVPAATLRTRRARRASSPPPRPSFAPAPALTPASARLSPASVAIPAEAAKAVAPAATPAERLSNLRVVADKAVEGIANVSGGEARGKADVQFSALTHEQLAASTADGVDAPSAKALADAPAPARAPISTSPPRPPRAAAKKADVPAPKAPKTGFFTVFRDPARNSAFWRYVSGYAIFLVGFEMYVVGMPYLISSMTTNSLKEHKDARVGNDEAVKELIRSNRSLSRIAHWFAQGVSYIAIPLFTRNQETDGPKKWLVKSMLIRAAVLAAVPAVFFATGVLGLHAAMWVLFGLIAAQAFFQGISVTAEGAATTRLLGDKSVTQDERTKANSILTVLASVIAIIGPLVAGQIALIGPVHGKSGVGGAVIYGIYAGAMALTGLIYAGIKMFGGQSADAKAAVARGEAVAESPAPKTFKGVMKELWISIKDGTRIVFKDRLLRTMLAMSLVSSLFSDPLVFNVLPEYIEGLVAKSPELRRLPDGHSRHRLVLEDLLTATPMGQLRPDDGDGQHRQHRGDLADGEAHDQALPQAGLQDRGGADRPVLLPRRARGPVVHRHGPRAHHVGRDPRCTACRPSPPASTASPSRASTRRTWATRRTAT